MSRRCSRFKVTVAMVICMGVAADAAVLHVPAEYPAIQTAIDSSKAGDVVLVSPGIYNENINFKGKAITVSSTNAADPTVAGSTIIHAVGRASAVTFASGETSNSILTGFTISGGYGTVNTNFGTNIFWGAGIYCLSASPTIVGNIITGNAAANGLVSDAGYGSGIGCIQSDAVISRNRIAGNSGYAGGGILTYLGRARITSNLIYSNSAAVGGGAVLISGSQLSNNTLAANAASGGAGNVYAASDTSGQCLVTGNIICNASIGGGIYVDTADTITQTAYNDVWNNTDGDYYAGTNRAGMNGNISQDPLFVASGNNDYHLQDISPCINAGDPNYQPAPAEPDFYGGSRVYARRVDIGAAEYFDNFRPLANAGPVQLLTVTSLPTFLTLDGSASTDPNGGDLSWHWSLLSGPAWSLTNTSVARPVFGASGLA
ncbi:MAG TPA: choice-of-anchor Q domain-containing protein, partial [Candidatus Dormibacteraeota bacterium]|nr:choice-of-anchor Q domain-containing protein [Candidatus Dormibacteraeota bacterium]